jgi:hypothetical protein
MSARVKSNAIQNAKRAEAVGLKNANWIWAVIVTTTALASLFVATLFTVALG